MSAVKQIISSLPKLTKAERQQLRQAMDFLDGGKNRVVVAAQLSTEDWLAPGLLIELRRRGLGHPPLSVDRLNSLAPNYAADSAALRADLREKLKRGKAQACAERLNHVELLAFGRCCARALAEYLQPSRPVGLKVLFTNVSRVPDALEASFPDYLATGMIWLLVGNQPQIGKGS